MESADNRPELIFAIVGPLGTRLEDLSRELENSLKGFRYKPVTIRLSELVSQFPAWKEAPGTTEAIRIEHLQKAANTVRKTAGDGGVLARAAVCEIRKRRAALTGSPDKPAYGHAFILYQLKHPEELSLLRSTYGAALSVVAGHAAIKNRRDDLSKQLALSANLPGDQAKFLSDAVKLIENDQKGGDDFSQNMLDLYPRCDYFVDLNTASGEYRISRFVDLLFGHPLHTPTPEEYAMYQASAAALRSSDLNRQVGAAIVNLVCDAGGNGVNADLIAVGMNEVPRAGGGFYWENASPDMRDQALTAEPANQIKVSALAELLERIERKGWLGDGAGNGDANDRARILLPDLKKTQFMNIGEFSRPVHAEMAAILDAARRGVGIDGQTIFVTTFPCHNCAKHIIAAGLKRVIYLEPYPKSRADLLYGEELELDSPDKNSQTRKVVFTAYSGLSPRQYRTLFSMGERGSKQGLTKNEWLGSKATHGPLYVADHLYYGYSKAEDAACENLGSLGYKH
jgi:cytidine deaminase